MPAHFLTVMRHRLPRGRTITVGLPVAVSIVSLWACAGAGASAGGREMSRQSPEQRWTITQRIADSVHTETLAPGVRLHRLTRLATPLRAVALDIDLAACVSLRALKASATAVGRTTTSALLRAVPAADNPIAAVNADFFLFAPPGVPVGAMVRDGTLLSGPIDRPVLAFDADNRPYVGLLTVQGTITTSRGSVPVATWNRPSASTIGVVDAAWGQPLDSLSRPGAMQLVPVGNDRFRIAALPLAHNGLARADTMMLVGTARASLIEHDTVRVELALGPFAAHNAVGGFPLLVRDSVIVSAVDVAGAESFRGVNPRTAAGFADNGRRLLLVVIDGRQAGYSAGTSTRATAELLRDLGAREAVNLDGGGSSAMVVRDAATNQIRVVNKPSDAVGERAVGNALAVLGSCSRTSTR